MLEELFFLMEESLSWTITLTPLCTTSYKILGLDLPHLEQEKKKKISVPSSAVFIESLFLSDSPVCLCCKRQRNPLHSSVSYTAPARSSPLLPSIAAGCGDMCAGV